MASSGRSPVGQEPNSADPLHDRPITSFSQDKLVREYHVDEIAKCIEKARPSASFTVAVVGPWGAGKSSLLNLLEERLCKRGDVRVLRFNPWSFDSSEKLVYAFLEALGRVIQNAKGGTLVNVSKSLRRIEAILLAAPAVGAAKGLWQSIDEFIFPVDNDPLESAKQAINEELRDAFECRVVVFIDDLDRLDNQSLRLVLKLVRLIADFPGVYYVLAYDRAQVEKALEPEGRRHLEKFVQASFELPRANPSTLRGIFEERLYEVMEEICEEPSDSEWDNHLHQLRRYWDNGLGDYLVTLRKVNVLV